MGEKGLTGEVEFRRGCTVGRRRRVSGGRRWCGSSGWGAGENGEVEGEVGVVTRVLHRRGEAAGRAQGAGDLL
jgi:hypothetical protein